MNCKKFFASAVLALVMSFGFVFAGVGFLKASAATDVTNEQFKVESMGVRFADGETKHGLRYILSVDKSTWESLADKQRKVTVHVAPEYQSVGMYISDIASAYSFDIGEEDWKLADDESKYTAAVYVSQIPEQAKELRIAVQGKLTFVEENVRTFYTEIKASSMADVAKYAVDNKLAEETKISAYMPSESTVTFKNGDGVLETAKIAHGAVVSDSYPEIAKNDNQYVVWNTADGKAWRNGWLAQGDITLTAVVKDYFGGKVDDCIYHLDKVTASAEAANEVAALGFTSAYELKQENVQYSGVAYVNGGSHQTTTDISAYKTVKFAIKTSANYRYDGGSDGKSDKILKATTWQIFTLTQTADKVWSLVVTDAEGNAVHSAENLTCDTNTIKSILWAKRVRGYNPCASSKGEVLRVFTTEVRGELKPIEKTGEIFLKNIYAGDSGEAEMNFTDSDETIPNGFTMVTEISKDFNGYDGTYGGYYLHGKMSHEALDNYSEVHFAMKSTSNYRIDNNKSATIKHYDDWLYFYLTKGETAWVVTVNYKDEQIASFTNSGTTICGLLWHSAAQGTTPCSEQQENFVVYMTEVRGTRLNASEIKITGEMIDEKLCRNVEISSVEDSAPAGFEKIWKTTTDGNKYLHGNRLSGADLSDYQEVHFAMMCGYQFGPTSGKAEVGGWVYVTLTRVDDNNWIMVATHNGKEVLRGNAKQYSGDNNYPSNSLAAANYNIWWLAYTWNANESVYFTELRGIKKA